MGLVAELLRQGKENAISADDLARMLGLSDKRRLRQLVSKERRQGVLILSYCGAGGGYYLPASREEVEEFCHVQEARGKTSFSILKSAHEYLNQTPGQESMEEVRK